MCTVIWKSNIGFIGFIGFEVFMGLSGSDTRIVENRIEWKMKGEMETGILQGLIGLTIKVLYDLIF